jgi:hypothetical protein
VHKKYLPGEALFWALKQAAINVNDQFPKRKKSSKFSKYWEFN